MNPVSVMSCLENERFGNYWCPTHSLEIVINKLYEDEEMPDHFIGFKEPVTSLYERNPTHNEIPTSVYMLLFGYLAIKEYNRNTDEVILDYPNDEIKEVLMNNFKIRLMLDYPTRLGKDQSNILMYLKLKQISPLVRLLNKLGFRNQAPAPYQLKLEHEFNTTTILYLIFRTIGLNSKIGAEMTNLPGNDRPGDIDLLIMTEEMSVVIEAKYEKKYELEGMKQLLGVIIKNENAFLDFIAKNRCNRKLPKTDEIYLLSLNFKKDKTGSTHSVDTSFIEIPYQPWEPPLHGGKETAMKLWFNHMEIRGNIKSNQHELENAFKSKLLDKAV